MTFQTAELLTESRSAELVKVVIIQNGGGSPSGNAGGDLSGAYPNPLIANNAITFAKMQTIPSSVLLGRSTAGTGVIEVITAATGRTILGLGTAATVNTGTTSGTLPVLETSGVLNAATIPNLDAAKITTGIFPVARLGTGTPTGSNFLRGDGTWAAPSGGGSSFTWNVITGTSATMSPNNGYIANNTGLVTLTLPTTAAQGATITVVGFGAGGWRISQNTDQIIDYLNITTTLGTSGSITTVNPGNSKAALEIVCVTANTNWVVVSATGTVNII